jgi:hypothetical protein
VCVHSSFKERNEFGEHQYSFRALRRHPKKLFKYFRLSIDTFDDILSEVHDSLEKPHPWWRTEEEYCKTLANASGYKLVCSQLCRSVPNALRHPSPPLVCFDSSVCTYLNHKRHAVPPLCKLGCTPSVFSVLLPSAEHCNGSCWLFSFNSSNITRYGPKTCSICRTVLILPSTERSQRCIFILDETPRICEPAKSEGWLYSTGLLQTLDKRRLIFGP